MLELFPEKVKLTNDYGNRVVNHLASKAHNCSVESPRKLKIGYGLQKGHVEVTFEYRH